MKIKQSGIMNLVNNIKGEMELSGKDVVAYTFRDLLSELKMTELQVEYNGGKEELINQLNYEKQLNWNNLGCTFTGSSIYFIHYESKNDNNEFNIDKHIWDDYVDESLYQESISIDEMGDLNFWLELGYSEDDLN